MSFSLKSTAQMSEYFRAEAIVVWPTFHSPPHSLTLRITTLIPLLFSSVNSSAGGRAMGGLVMTDPFRHYPCPGLRWTWGYLSLPGRTALLGGPLFCFIFFFLYGYYQKFFIFYLFYWLRLLLIVCGDVELNPGPGSDKRVRVPYSNIRILHVNLDE